MSRKRKKDLSEKKGGIVALDLSSGESDEKSSAIETFAQSENSKAGIITYLKTHLWVVGVIAFLALGALGAGLKYLDEDAKSEIAKRAYNKGNLNTEQDQSFLNKVNPFLPTPTPAPTPQLSKEYIYAGSRLLAVEDANVNAAPPADLAVWRPATGYWWVMKPDGNTQASVGWGQVGDDPVEGDYDGDGKTDFAVYRPASGSNPGTWWIMRSSDNSYYTNSLGGLVGTVADTAAPADYDGDGRTDPAVFRSSTGVWYILQSSTNQVSQGQFGQSGDMPAPADYDGDGRADIGIWRSSQNAFYSVNSSNNQMQTPTFDSSQTGNKIVSADYDGDGRADYALYNTSSSNWYIFQSSNGQVVPYQWGASNSEPVQNDYDGDGKCDLASWKDGQWTIRNSSNPSPPRTAQWGISGDIPVPALYRR